MDFEFLMVTSRASATVCRIVILSISFIVLVLDRLIVGSIHCITSVAEALEANLRYFTSVLHCMKKSRKRWVP